MTKKKRPRFRNQREKPGKETIMSELIVTKSNHLVEAGYKLTLNEQRLILSVIAISRLRTYALLRNAMVNYLTSSPP